MERDKETIQGECNEKKEEKINERKREGEKEKNINVKIVMKKEMVVIKVDCVIIRWMILL